MRNMLNWKIKFPIFWWCEKCEGVSGWVCEWVSECLCIFAFVCTCVCVWWGRSEGVLGRRAREQWKTFWAMRRAVCYQNIDSNQTRIVDKRKRSLRCFPMISNGIDGILSCFYHGEAAAVSCLTFSFLSFFVLCSSSHSFFLFVFVVGDKGRTNTHTQHDSKQCNVHLFLASITCLLLILYAPHFFLFAILFIRILCTLFDLGSYSLFGFLFLFLSSSLSSVCFLTVISLSVFRKQF